jgi:RNA polymerase sigma-70 factor (ECF subfamily)
LNLERLIDEHKDAVYRQMVRTCGGHRDDAEDALAEALYAAIKASHQLRNPEQFRAWLARIGTRSCARMRIRERLLRLSSLDDLEKVGIEIAADDSPTQEVEMNELKECVSGAVELLPDIYRTVYLRREILGEPAEKVSKDLGLSLPALKSRLHRARELMRDSLDHGLGCRSLLED